MQFLELFQDKEEDEEEGRLRLVWPTRPKRSAEEEERDIDNSVVLQLCLSCPAAVGMQKVLRERCAASDWGFDVYSHA